MTTPRTPAPRTVRTLLAVAAALVLVLVTGCGVRLETPPPAPLVPDADEQARQRASADAVALEVLAAVTPPGPDPATDPVGAARAAVAAEAATHLDLLGGLYDAGPDAGEDRPGTPAATPAPEPAAPAAVVTALTEGAATARDDTAMVTDGALARLLGSIAVSRQLSAVRLAAAAGLPAPVAPSVARPEAVPEGLDPADLGELVAAEDAAGYGYEVIAAKHGGDTRRLAGDRAVVHRSRAQTWAELGELDGTGLDPRRVAYAVPPGLEDPAAAAALADHYAALVAGAAPGARPDLVDAVAEATAHALAWGAALPALPGLPERSAG